MAPVMLETRERCMWWVYRVCGAWMSTRGGSAIGEEAPPLHISISFQTRSLYIRGGGDMVVEEVHRVVF